MRRIACWVVAGIAASSLGCQDKKNTSQVEPIQSAEVDYGALQPELYAPAEPVTDSQTTLVSTNFSPYDEPVSPPVDYDRSYGGSSYGGASNGGTHVVMKGDTLYRLARKYYNDASQWRTIYEANRSSISNPNLLRVGQELMIP